MTTSTAATEWPSRPPRCGICLTDDGPWLVNPAGGYGRAQLYACLPCLHAHPRLVGRLLEAYPASEARRLRLSLAFYHYRGIDRSSEA